MDFKFLIFGFFIFFYWLLSVGILHSSDSKYLSVELGDRLDAFRFVENLVLFKESLELDWAGDPVLLLLLENLFDLFYIVFTILPSNLKLFFDEFLLLILLVK